MVAEFVTELKSLFAGVQQKVTHHSTRLSQRKRFVAERPTKETGSWLKVGLPAWSIITGVGINILMKRAGKSVTIHEEGRSMRIEQT